MGHIKSQTIKGSIFSYLGVILGFAISGLILPRILTTGENGLLKLLIAWSALFAQFGTLGFAHATGRLFSVFRDEKSNHHGFFALTAIVSLAGFAASMLAFWLLLNPIIEDSQQNSALFIHFIDFLVPLIFFTLLYLMLDVYFKMLFKTVIGTFVKEFLLRIFILISIGLYYFNIVDFKGFITAYVIANSLPGIILLAILIQSEKLKWKPDLAFLTPELKKSLGSMSFYGIILGFSGIMIFNIDSIMISRMVGIEATGIYAITYFFGTLIIIPSRSLRKIAGTVLAEAWLKQDMKTIAEVYYKSSITQTVIGVLIFIGLWANIHNVFQILPAEYQAGMWVIFFIGLTNLIEMSSGVSDILIQTSRDYRYAAFLNIVFLLFVLIFNYLFISIFGLVGAAIANSIAFALNSLLRYWFIYKRYKIYPFSGKHLVVLGIGLMVYVINLLLPPLKPYLLDIALRSLLITFVFVLAIYRLRVSEDISTTIEKSLIQVRKMMQKLKV